ncbi:propanediol utilization protein [bacterium]|nr:MAG: propanediol utilization protein [bacterium]
MDSSIGLLEFISIAKGFEATDAMIKAAEVKLLLAKTVCSGKFITLISGLVQPVEDSVSAGLNVAKTSCVDHIVIPNLHPDVIPAISATTGASLMEALGIIETYTVASCIKSADIAAKSGEVRLLELRPAVGLGGKSFVTITGDIASVESAVELGAEYPKSRGVLLQKVVIPHPYRKIGEIV